MTSTVTMTAAVPVSAAVSTSMPALTLTANKAGTGSGTVTASPPGIECGTSTSCSANYASGTTVTLPATATAGSIFTGWSGCDAVSGTRCTVTMNAARSVTAAFTRLTFILTASNAGTGSGPDFVAVGDFNGDGKPDLAVANFNSNNISVLLGNGDGTFQAARTFAVDSGP